MRLLFFLPAMLVFNSAMAETKFDVLDLASGREVTVSVETPAGQVPVLESENAQPFVESGSYLIPERRLLELKEAKGQYADYARPDPSLVEEEDDFVEFGIVGEDTREYVRSTIQFPASAIAQIKFKDAYGKDGLCTGSLISRDTVLTAGHCVRGLNVLNFALVWHADFDVYPGRNGPVEPYSHCGVSKIFVLSEWDGKDGNHDIAALRLDCDVGSQVGHWGVRAAQSDDLGNQLTVQGYPADKIPEGRQFKSHDVMHEIDDYRIGHKADTVGGNSGSPVFSGDDHRIFAVHASMIRADDWTRENKAATINFATRITEGRLNVINHWITHDR